MTDRKDCHICGYGGMADAEDLKSSDLESCGFKPHYPYCIVNMTSESVQQIEWLCINEGDEINEYIKTII